jgi:type I restriction enzyme S subunit
LFYFLFSEIGQQQIESSISGSAQGGINKSIQDNILVFYPPLPEQSRIATVLSYFDDLIELKIRQNEILEKTAMAIFKSWFIDFEPFKDGEFVYNEEMGKEIPKGWEVDKTTRFIQYNPSISIRRGEIYPLVEMKDVKSNSLACEFSIKEFNGSGVKYSGGDTLMARITPSLEHGKTAFVWFISEKEKGFGSTEFFVLHPKEPYLKEFVYLLAKNEDFREVAINSMSGTSGRQRADVNALKNYLIAIPPPPILQSFHSLVEPLFQKIILNQKEIMTLRKIRDTLLPLLVFGKLRIEEV